MKNSLRLSPISVVLLTGILSAFFTFPSPLNLIPWTHSSAKADSFDQQLVRLRSDINLLIKKRTYAPALSKVKRYVMLVARKYGHRHNKYASALDLQARVYRYLKRPVEARRYAARAASIRKNNRNFKAKITADRQKRIREMHKRRAEIRARMVQERRETARRRAEARAKRLQPERRTQRPVIRRKKQVMPKQYNAPRRPLHVPPPHNKETVTGSGSTPRGYQKPSVQKKSSRRSASHKKTTRSAARRARPTPRPRDSISSKPAAPREFPVAKSITPPAPLAAPAPILVQPDVSPHSASAPGAPAAMGAVNKNHTIVKVYYATDRQRTTSTKLASLFGGQPSDPKRISYGICEVSIPKGHVPGQLEAPSIWRFEFKENPDEHVVLLKVHPQPKSSYFRNLKKVIDRSKGNNAFIFIHGYNVTFSDAARRTAQITYDLGFDGAPVFYSWPSTGELSGYPLDEDNILWAQQNVKHFLQDFVEKTQAKNIYLIAHSMGSRALTGAVSSLILEQPQFKKRFREIILAAPDISARIFRDNIAPKMIEASNNVTLYVSADDKALLASRKFHSNQRAGEAGDNLILIKGIDTIDATGIDASLLAHSYFAEAKSIISDILSIIRYGRRPQGRGALRKVETSRGNYWTFATK